MASSDLFATTDPRIQKLIRQYSDYFRQNNLSPEKFTLTQSSHPQMYTLTQPNELLQNGDARRGSDARSLIEQLIYNKKKQMKSASNPKISINPSRPVLVSTEQRIFQEIIGLLQEINNTKQAIQKEKELTMQLQVQRDNLVSKGNAKAKGKIVNSEMESIINQLKMKELDNARFSQQKISQDKQMSRVRLQQKQNLEYQLQQQRQKHKQLKKKLQQRNSDSHFSTLQRQSASLTQFEIQEISKLQQDIKRLEKIIVSGGNFGYQINKLSAENQYLRTKTRELIRDQDQELGYEQADQRTRLEEYILMEEQNKMLFLEDLKKFKQEYKELREENQHLKAQMKGSRALKTSQSNKFMKYKDLIGEMAEMMI